MKMKHLAVAIIAGAFAFGLSSAQAEDPLRIGVEGAYPPFSEKTVRAGLGRHHPGAAGPQIRRHRRLDVDHRRA
jgi:hypothetical protein